MKMLLHKSSILTKPLSNLFFQTGTTTFTSGTIHRGPFRKTVFRNIQQKKIIPILAGVVGLIVLIIIGGKIVDFISGAFQSRSLTAKPKLPETLAKQNINRAFSFSLRDREGKEVSKISYKINDAVLQNDIIVQGKRNRAVEGRIFLVVNLKINNQFQQGIKINSRDYIRLKVNTGSELLAPEIHNDPVEVQAISTKYTRLGFAINESDRNLMLQVGEINGTKEIIKLTL